MIYKNILETRKKKRQERTALKVGKATINILQLTLIFAGILSILILTGEKVN
jgi:hypothetical protein